MPSTSANTESAARIIAIGAVLAAIGVGMGAFGAHALQARVTPARLEVWHTAVLYHLVHALGLLAIGIWLRLAGGRAWPAWVLVAGIGLFSGSLYALVLLDLGLLGAVTPLGGICFIVGWLGFAHQAWSRGRAE